MKSYLKFLSRNKLYTFIMLFGLSVSLAFIILLFCYAIQEYSTVAGQPLAKELYAIGNRDRLGMTYGTAEHVMGQIPEVKDYTRALRQEWNIYSANQYYRATSLMVDPNFFKLFKYNILDCDGTSVLNSTDNVLVSKSFALKTFGAASPIGKTIVVKAKDKEVSLVVAGIIEDFDNDIFYPVDFIMNIRHPYLCLEEVLGLNYMDNFGTVFTFVKLPRDVNESAVRKKLLDEYKKTWDFWDKSEFLSGSSLVSINDLYFSDFSRDGDMLVRHGNRKMVNILVIAAIMLLISALFNYINLTVAQTGSRAKEMAIRRLLGSSKVGIFLRYIGESFLFTLICFAVGYFIAYALSDAAGEMLKTDLNLRFSSGILAFYLLLVVVVSIISGILPALFVSRFKPIDVVKGTFRFKSKMVFGKIFIVAQNIISVVLIAVALTMNSQINYLANLPKGYNSKEIVYIDIWGALNPEGIDVLAQKLKTLPFVEEVGKCNGNPALGAGGQIVAMPDGSERTMTVSMVDSISFKILGFKVIESYGEPVSDRSYYTRDAAAQLGIKPDYVPDKQRCVMPCGIIEDYRQGDALYDKYGWDSKGCLNVVYIMPDNYEYIAGLLVKTRGDAAEVLNRMNDITTSTVQEITGIPRSLQIDYIDNILDSGLIGSKNIMNLVMAFMIISVIISSLGLFGMSVYYTKQRAKGIALRKVYGSTVIEVMLALVKNFMFMVIIAVIIAIPLAVYISQRYLETFPNREVLGIWIFVAAVSIAVFVAGISIVEQTLRAANANPVENLNRE